MKNRIKQLDTVKERLIRRFKEMQNSDAVMYQKYIEERHAQEVSKAKLEEQAKIILNGLRNKK